MIVIVVIVTVVIVIVVVAIVVVFMVVHVFAVLVVSMPEHKVTIDRVTLAVDHLDVVQQPVGGLRLADLRDQLGDSVVLLVHAADVAGLAAELHRHPGVLHVEFVVADLEPFT
ncbi:MAG TPA: hypothetical protein VGK49_11975, partial [Ilumatobacteraceae bacterium]